MTIISKITSAALIHFYLTDFNKCFPVNILSSYFNATLIPTNILSIYSYSPFMIALANLMIGSITKAQKALLIGLPSSSVPDFYHFLDFGLK
jgi:hypothetical protein